MDVWHSVGLVGIGLLLNKINLERCGNLGRWGLGTWGRLCLLLSNQNEAIKQNKVGDKQNEAIFFHLFHLNEISEGQKKRCYQQPPTVSKKQKFTNSNVYPQKPFSSYHNTLEQQKKYLKNFFFLRDISRNKS